MTLAPAIREYGDHLYVTSPVQLYVPERAEIEAFAFAPNIRDSAPNPQILWLKGQYVEADAPNRNNDAWTAGELEIKSLTPVLMPVTVMHDLRSAVGTIADAKLMTPAADQVPRARIDTTLAVWSHRFPDIAAECQVNAQQSTLMQSMECLAPYYDCSVCGATMQRHANWEKEWRGHVAAHAAETTSAHRSVSRTLRNVTFTGVGLIFGTRGARGAMPDAHLEVEELAAMHREAHASTARTVKRPRRKNTVEIEDSKYEGMVAAAAESSTKVTTLTAEAAEKDRRIETLEAENVTLKESVATKSKEADDAKEAQRVAAMADERLSALGAGFMAKLSKLETTAKRVKLQAAAMSDEDWTARLEELEESLGVKADAKADEGDGDKGDKGNDALAGTLFDKETVAKSGVGAGTEVTASEAGKEVSVAHRQSVMGGLIRGKSKTKAAA